MARTITVAPVTRVEGHGKVTIHLDHDNQVESAHFHVMEYRGFEKFCEGRLLSEMPVITTRICGICPVSHHLAAAKAADDVLGIEIPPAAKKLRELMHMGQIVQSHAMHFFHLAAPDFLLGHDSEPAKRNIFGLIQTDPALAKQAIRLRQIGQDIIDRVGGRSIHPVTAIPGGMSQPLSHEHRFASRRDIDEAVELAQVGLEVGKRVLSDYRDHVPRFAVLPTSYLGTVRDGRLDLYDGELRIIDQAGTELERFEPRRYLEYIGEAVEDFSYLKFPFYRKLGYPAGTYRVGPLGRLNVADRIGTPLASKELAEFKALGGGKPVHQTLYYHLARLIEILYAAERARELLDDDEIVSSDVRVVAERAAGEGVGVIEAPRGTLIHHYWVDELGKLERVNLIVATGHNNPAIDASVAAVAKEYVKGGKLEEGALNLVEMAIRCYDPCLSCSTHAAGRMPLTVQVLSAGGEVVDTVERKH